MEKVVKPGAFHLTSGGYKVLIVEINWEKEEILGVARNGDGDWIFVSYNFLGRELSGEAELDLSPYYLSCPKIDRAVLPAWANKAIARDRNGAWHAFNFVPCKYMLPGIWFAPDVKMDLIPYRVDLPSDLVEYSGDWENSLLVFDVEV